jgi:hypothetical protein
LPINLEQKNDPVHDNISKDTNSKALVGFMLHKVHLVKNIGSNSWMVTGYKLISPDASSSARDALEATRSTSTPSRNGVVAGTKTIAQQDNNSSDIKFSRSSTTEINQSIKEAFAKAQGKPALGWLGGLFQRNHLIDFVAKDLHGLLILSHFNFLG